MDLTEADEPLDVWFRRSLRDPQRAKLLIRLRIAQF